MKKMDMIISKYENRINKAINREPKDSGYDNIRQTLLNFAIEVLEPANNLYENLEYIFDNRQKRKSKHKADK